MSELSSETHGVPLSVEEKIFLFGNPGPLAPEAAADVLYTKMYLAGRLMVDAGTQPSGPFESDYPQALYVELVREGKVLEESPLTQTLLWAVAARPVTDREGSSPTEEAAYLVDIIREVERQGFSGMHGGNLSPTRLPESPSAYRDASFPINLFYESGMLW